MLHALGQTSPSWADISLHALGQTPPLGRRLLLRTVRILLECILVTDSYGYILLHEIL